MPNNQAEWTALRRQVLDKAFARMNERQREAVFQTQGPVLILAGAGSGKTTVLINRIANLIRYGAAYHSDRLSAALGPEDAAACRAFLAGSPLPEEIHARLAVDPVAPWRIMAITFTNKAAGELKDRLCTLLGDRGNDVWASTFHAGCARILRRDGDRLGFTSHFTIYDTDDSRRLMKSVMEELNISEKALSPKGILGEIARAKDELLGPQAFARQAGADYRLKVVAQAYAAYQRRLKNADAMDFDDLLVHAVRLFREHPDVLARYQDRLEYIMVDEFQDTNHAQYEFVRLLAQRSGNLCVVGDDDQSIYKFRGATIENIMHFEEDFPGTRVVRLEQNYRSTQNILDAANGVIRNNTERKGKTLWTAAGPGEKLHLHLAENETDEADRVAQVILEGVARGKKYSDYAVLYRMNSQSLSFERMFAKQAIPHRIIGGTRFFDRREVRDMIAYLSVIENPEDQVRLERIINTPKRAIGQKTVDTALEIAQQTGESLYRVISHAEDFPLLSRTAAKLKGFVALIDRLAARNRGGMPPSELYGELLEQTGYLAFLRTDEPDKAEERVENVQELSSMLQRYEQEAGDDASLEDFLEEVALFTDIDNYDAGADSVVLMTMHAAKGLEFPTVFLPGWEEGVFPGSAVLYDPAQVEEERRLAYVALTRAREAVYLYHAQSRMIFGTTSHNRLSRFAQEIPPQLVEETRSLPTFTRPEWSKAPEEGIWTRDGFTGKLPDSRGPRAGAFARETYQPHPVKPAPAGTYRTGGTVRHRTFGTGVILNATPMANDTLLEIAFDQVGTKKLFANFARLEKL